MFKANGQPPSRVSAIAPGHKRLIPLMSCMGTPKRGVTRGPPRRQLRRGIETHPHIKRTHAELRYKWAADLRVQPKRRPYGGQTTKYGTSKTNTKQVQGPREPSTRGNVLGTQHKTNQQSRREGRPLQPVHARRRRTCR